MGSAGRRRRSRFAERYTCADAELLATMDETHDTISGPATRKLLQRAHYDFQDARYTNTRAWRIGERSRPEPHGRPGYLRVDTVHQEDQDGIKGVYHTTQWTK
jgi:hypothetical protein